MHFLCHCCTSRARSNIKCIVKPLKNESSIAALTNDSINFVCPLEWTRLSYVHFFVFYVALAARWAIEYWKRSAKNQQNTGQQCFSFVRDRIRLLSFESSFFPTTTANAIMHRIVKVKFWVRLHSAALCEERKQKKKKNVRSVQMPRKTQRKYSLLLRRTTNKEKHSPCFQFYVLFNVCIIHFCCSPLSRFCLFLTPNYISLLALFVSFFSLWFSSVSLCHDIARAVRDCLHCGLVQQTIFWSRLLSWQFHWKSLSF